MNTGRESAPGSPVGSPVARTASASNQAFRKSVRPATDRSTATAPKHGHGAAFSRNRFATTAPVNRARSPTAAKAGTDEWGIEISVTAIASSTDVIAIAAGIESAG